MSEGSIVSSVLGNYTKMLPEQEDAVEVSIEMHLQVSNYLVGLENN